MEKGKIAAQSAHAAIGAMQKTEKVAPSIVKQWLEEGQKKVVLKVGSEAELMTVFKEISKSVPTAIIRDAGHTQVEPGSITCIGIGPWYDDELDRLTGHLKLL